jgi:Na+/alanine symporter
VLIFALVGCGVWFTIKTRFVQFRMVGEMFRLLTDSAVTTVEEQVKSVPLITFSFFIYPSPRLYASRRLWF